MKSLVFVTGNPYKFEIAKKVLEPAGITLEQQKIETPEIQSTEVSEIAAYSAKWAAVKLNQPVAVTDAGYYFEALNGFPGPFVKYINKWLTAEELLALMVGKINRNAEIRICLAYCEPNEEPIIFQTIAKGTISEKPSTNEKSFAVDRIFIPEGFDKPICDLPKEEMVRYWSGKENYWKELIGYLHSMINMQITS